MLGRQPPAFTAPAVAAAAARTAGGHGGVGQAGGGPAGVWEVLQQRFSTPASWYSLGGGSSHAEGIDADGMTVRVARSMKKGPNTAAGGAGGSGRLHIQSGGPQEGIRAVNRNKSSPRHGWGEGAEEEKGAASPRHNASLI
jgi:hypothetical protein